MPQVLGDGRDVVDSGLTLQSPCKRQKTMHISVQNVKMSMPNVSVVKFSTPTLSVHSEMKVKEINQNQYQNGKGIISSSQRVPQRRPGVTRRALPKGTQHLGSDPPVQPLRGAIAPLASLTRGIQSPLLTKVTKWVDNGSPKWVVRTIRKGYRLQFARKPPTFSKVIFSEGKGQAGNILQQEILSLLDKGAIQEVPKDQMKGGFYSRYFLVAKKGGGLRPILDLRALNRYLKVFKFKMLTNATLLRSMRQGDWLTSIDLTDAYFHISVYPPHRKFLRFGFRGRVYEYTALPFGLSLSPRVFVLCTKAAIAPLRRQGVRLATYIDDWLLCANSKAEAEQHTRRVVTHLTDLGFRINYNKSTLIPAQTAEFIGIALNTVSYTARLSPDRIQSFLSCLARFRLDQMVQISTCRRLAGLMASAISLIRLGRLRMRPFQQWMASLRVPTYCQSRLVRVTVECMEALRHWTDPAFLSEGVIMGTVASRQVITTDASLSGWGATHDGRTARGTWDSRLVTFHINYLELMAVFLALRRFLPWLRGHHVLVRSDNMTTVSYINKQGGLRSPVLHKLAHDLIVWCEPRLLSLRATHVPGVWNRGADLLSRGTCRYGDWSLHTAIAAQIWDRYGRPQIDLFASPEDAKCPLFFSVKGTAPLGLDALAHEWPRVLLYAFPPLCLIAPTLERVRTDNLTVLLVAPEWGQWVSEIVPLLYGCPWQLPLRRDMLTQAGGEIFHPQPEHLALWVWPVKG